jgi:hexosaminidase
MIQDGRIHANVAYPGLAIRYTTDGSEPTAESPLYDAPIPAAGAVRLKSFDTRGRGSRTVDITPHDASAAH